MTVAADGRRELSMQIVCQWCKRVMVEGDPSRVSHGLHRSCVAAYCTWAGYPEGIAKVMRRTP